MKAYHEVNSDSLGSVLDKGINRTSRGNKSDSAIVKTDTFLDAHRPKRFKDEGVNRSSVIYCYLATTDGVMNIADGKEISLKELSAQHPSSSLLEVDLDPQQCYVSDLDTYDALKQAIGDHKDAAMLETLAAAYWRTVVRLFNYEPESIFRPEIMVPYDIRPTHIKRASLN